jgi:hypothetical protein
MNDARKFYYTIQTAEGYEGEYASMDEAKHERRVKYGHRAIAHPIVRVDTKWNPGGTIGGAPLYVEQPPTTAELRLEYLRGELRAERISWGELAELQGLAEHIADDDMELREAAGLPEHGV